MNTSDYRPDIDGLRAVAVLAVVFFHAGFTSFSGGFVGVDVFFVISGFLITRLIKNKVEAGTFTFGDFYMRRVRRLAPSMLVTVALSSIFAFYLFTPADLELFAGSLIAALLSVSNIFFWWTTDYFGAEAQVQPLLHTWSLAVEEQFYFIWPALLVLLLTKVSRRILFGFLIVAGAASLVAAETWLERDAGAAFFLLPFRVTEFAIGAAMAWIVLHRPHNPRVLEPLLLLGATMVLVPVFWFTEATRFPGVAALLPCIGTAILIYAGNAPALGGLLRNPLARNIGLISYTLYLVHWPVIVFYKYYFFRDLGLLDQWAIVFISLVLAVLIYVTVERPLRHGRWLTWTIPNPAFLAGTAAAVIALSATAAVAYQQQGWEWRIPEDRREWLAQSRAIGSKAMKEPAGATHRVLLLGDSHARHYAPMLFEYFATQGIHLIRDKRQCIPVPDVMRFRDGTLVKSCARHSRRLKARIANGDYDAVILASRWSSSLEGTVDPWEEGASWRRFWLADEDSIARGDTSPENSKRLFRKHMNAFFAFLDQSNLPTLVMGEVPPLGINLRPCLVNQGQACLPRYTREAAETRTGFARQVFMAAQAEHANVRFSDAFANMCGDSTAHCTAFDGNVFLYQDGNHINRTGSIKLLARFQSDLDGFVERLRAARPEGVIATQRAARAER